MSFDQDLLSLDDTNSQQNVTETGQHEETQFKETVMYELNKIFFGISFFFTLNFSSVKYDEVPKKPGSSKKDEQQKKKTKRPVMPRNLSLNLRKSHFLCLLARYLSISEKLASNEEFQALVLSILPQDIFQLKNKRKQVDKILQFFHKTFEIDKSIEREMEKIAYNEWKNNRDSKSKDEKVQIQVEEDPIPITTTTTTNTTKKAANKRKREDAGNTARLKKPKQAAAKSNEIVISDDDNELDRNDNTKESIKSSDRKPILCDDDLTAFVLQELKNAINSRKIANKAHLAFLIYSLICSFEIRSRLVCVLPIYPFTSLEKPTKSAQEMIYIEFLIGEDWSVIDSDMQQVLKEVPSIKAPYIFAFENGTRLLNCQLCLTFLFLFCFSKNNKKKKDLVLIFHQSTVPIGKIQRKRDLRRSGFKILCNRTLKMCQKKR